MLDSVFRTTKQVVAALHTNCIAVVPLADKTAGEFVLRGVGAKAAA